MPVTTLEEAYRHCQAVTRREARNFYFAFITLPPARRRAIYAVYAFCRMCDDVADQPLPLEEKALRLRGIGQALSRALEGHPQGPVFVALAHTVERYRIPPGLLGEVLRGVEMDLTVHRYRTFEELRTYCYRVASAVGLICLEVFGYHDPRARDYAVDLGLGMQLTNILRDVAEDLERGRIYIPLEDMERFGYTEGELRAGVVNENFRRLMAFEAERARAYFHSARRLLPLLSPPARACPAVLGGLYRRLLDRIEARGYNVFQQRARLSTGEKLALTVKLWAQSLLPQLPGLRVSW